MRFYPISSWCGNNYRSVASRMICYELTSNEILATVIGDVLGILFAFATNDTIVLSKKKGLAC